MSGRTLVVIIVQLLFFIVFIPSVPAQTDSRLLDRLDFTK